MKKIRLYSDGSSLGNPGAGGWGTILKYNDNIKELSGAQANTTNNQMELLGAIKGLEALKEPCDVTIYSDSSYVVNGINEWLEGWIKRNFKKVKNPELWQSYIEAAKPHKIKAVWVRGHNGHPENERCDELARNTAEQFKGKSC